MSFQATTPEQTQFASPVKSSAPTGRVVGVTQFACVLLACTPLTGTDAFSTTLPSTNSKLPFVPRSARKSARKVSSLYATAHDYEGEEEMTGPFFFSGEPKVDETSVVRLETLFQEDSPTPKSTSTTFLEEPKTVEFRDAMADERIERLREIFNDGESSASAQQDFDSAWQ